MVRQLLGCTGLGLGLMLAATAQAHDCGDRLMPLLSVAYPDLTEEPSEFGAVLLRVASEQARWIELDKVACKVWPSDPDKTLLAVVLRDSPLQDTDSYDADLEVMVADSNLPLILQRHRQPRAVVSDAIFLREVTLDTARYDLGPVRAFGVRVTHQGSSRVNPFAATALSLYEPSASSLRRVLHDLRVLDAGGEWDGNCAGAFSDAQSTVSLDERRDHGYRRLRIDRIEKLSRQAMKSEECEGVDDPPTRQRDGLRYDGQRYVVPAALSWSN